MPLIHPRYDSAIGAILGGVSLISLTAVAPVSGDRPIFMLLRSAPIVFYGLGAIAIVVGVRLILRVRKRSKP